MRKFLCALILVAACSTSDDSPMGEGFIGTWAYRSGGGTYSCDDGQHGELGFRNTARWVFDFNDTTEDPEDLTFSYSSDCTYNMDPLDRYNLTTTENGTNADCMYADADVRGPFNAIITVDDASSVRLNDDGDSLHAVQGFNYVFDYETTDLTCALDIDVTFNFHSSDVIR